MPPRWPIGQCPVCLGWGGEPQYAGCRAGPAARVLSRSAPRGQRPDPPPRRIEHRDLSGYDRLKDTAIAFAAGRGLSTAWWRAACRMLRLVLAVRESDGDDLIPEETLDDLPRFRNAVAGVLRHGDLTSAGLLRPRRRARPVVLPRPQRSCTHCDCWGSRTICSGCSAWNHQPALHPVADCTRCRRPAVPLLDGLCRACCLHIDRHGPGERTQAWTQLWRGGDVAPSLAKPHRKLRCRAPQQQGRSKAAARRPPAPPLSPPLIPPAHALLFRARPARACFPT